jgi:RNA polymerase sigma-70 factor (ECF subfamily)
MFDYSIKNSFQLRIDERPLRSLNGADSMSGELKTRKSLLSRLRKASNDGDWQSLYDQYRHIILSFCHKQGLDEFSAEDVLQETMVLLMRKLPQFHYDPEQGRFRNWLLRLVSGKSSDARKRAHRAKSISMEEVFEREEAPSPTDNEGIESIENAWRQALMEEGLRRIKSDPRTKSETFQVFQNYVLNGSSVAEVAKAFQIEENAIYQIKNRMLRRLTAEVMALEENRRASLM